MGKRKRVIEYSDSEESSNSSNSADKLDPKDWYVPSSDDEGDTADKSEGTYRIPRKSDYTSATDEVPSPPQPAISAERVRVRVSEEAKERFEKYAKGVFLAHGDRESLLQGLPMLASDFAARPIVDEELVRASPQDSRIDTRRFAVNVLAGQLQGLHDISLNVLQCVELVRKLGADANGAPFAADVEGYFDVMEQLLAASLKDLVGYQREAALRGLGLNPAKAVPSFRVAPLADSTKFNDKSNAMRPQLFGRKLLEEISAKESSLQKGIQALKHSSKKKDHSKVGRYMDRKDQFVERSTPVKGDRNRKGRSADSADTPTTSKASYKRKK